MTSATVRTESLAGGLLVIRGFGAFDWTSLAPLRDALGAAVRSGPARLAVDLSQATFMDTAAIGVLIGGFRQAQRAGVEFSVPNPHPFILRVLTVMGLAALLAVSTETDAPSQPPQAP